MSNEPQWHLANIWENVAEAIPDAPAVSMGDRQLTWREYEPPIRKGFLCVIQNNSL